MASNDISSQKEQSKTVICKNCRQDILAEKMFLHEGFCQRNNVFCEHCEKVFLKKDYNYHIKKLSKKENEKNEEANLENENENKIRTINIYRSPIITKKNTHFEYIEMPIVEQYTIRKPIYISENGQILSNKNQNEFLLPYFGISNVQNNNISSDEFFKDDIILNQETILKENHAFIANNKVINDIVFAGSIRNSVITDDLNIPHSHQEDGSLKATQMNNKDEIGQKNKIINLEIDGNLNNKIGFYNKSQSLNKIKNGNVNDKLVEDNFIHKNRISLSNDNHKYVNKELNNSKNNNINNINNIDGKINSQSNKKNNIIINNNIITYNSNNNINKIHNFYSKEKTPNKMFYTENNSNNISEDLSRVPKDKDKETATFNQTRILSGEDMKNFRKKLKKNLMNNNLKSSLKEPDDSRANKMISSLNEKIPLNSKNKNNKYNIKPKPQSLENKAYKNRRIKCDFCDKYCEDLVLHYKLCHLKKNSGLLKPNKRDTVLLNEKLNSDSIDEVGIDETKQRILLRQFRSTFHTDTISAISDNKNENENEEQVKIKNIQLPIKKKEKNEKNEKNEKKGFPEDSKRSDLLKTQGRNYRRKKIEEPLNNDKNIRSESRFGLNRMVISFQNSPKIKKTQVFFNNEKIIKKVSASPMNVRERINFDKISDE